MAHTLQATMKCKLTILLTLLLFVIGAGAQSARSFAVEGGRYRLVELCQWLNKHQDANISFNHDEKALQKEVTVIKDTYTFERLFDRYFRSFSLEYKAIGSGIIIYGTKEAGPYKKKAQTHGMTINGYITDSASGERIQGATIAAINQGLGTTSNAYGFYSLTLPEAQAELIVNVVGYEPALQTIILTGDTVMAFQLAPVTTTLSSVEVAATRTRKIPIQQSTQMSMVDLPMETIASMPKLLGETDVFRSLQFLPGVMAGNEVSSGLYVRGGSPDQNLILLDGVPVYNASHLFGLFSVFNADALQSVQLFKGGFPARYGGRLSSVIDLRMKEGNKYSWHGEGAISDLSSRFTIEGPLSKGRSSVMLSGRITNLAPLMRLISKLTNDEGFEGKAAYGFYDLNLKSNYYLGKNDHLYISAYLGRDRLYTDEKYTSQFSGSNYTSYSESGLKWGNATAVARWNHQFSKKMFANTTLHFSRYKYGAYTDESRETIFNAQYVRYYQKNSSDLQDLALKFDLDIIPVPGHYIRTGLSATRHLFIPGNYHSITEDNGHKENITVSAGSTVSAEYDVYVEDDISITSKLKANIGVHGTAFKVGSRFYTSLQPRVSARYLLHDKLSLKGSFVYMNQFIHLLSNSGIGLPTDLWVPVTENIPPQKSFQYAAGAAYTSASNIEFSMEAYIKTMDHVLEYEEGASFTNTTINWEQRVAIGNGKSRGLEMMIQKKKGTTNGLVSYTWSKSDRTFANINEGKTFPYRYDRRHDFKFVVVHQFSPKSELSADWIFSTGQAMTVPLQTYVDGNGEQITVYSERNAFRMPAYHRGDISMSFHKQHKKFRRTWVLGLFNVYGRDNPLFISLDRYNYVGNDNRSVRLRQTSIFAFPIPSISYQIKF